LKNEEKLIESMAERFKLKYEGAEDIWGNIKSRVCVPVLKNLSIDWENYNSYTKLSIAKSLFGRHHVSQGLFVIEYFASN